MNYFKGLIHCTKCGKRYNAKSDKYFICSGSKNYGKEFCNSDILHLSYLLQIIDHHCQLNGKKWELSKAKLFIKMIEVGYDGIVIRWRDGETSIVSHNIVRF